MEVDGGAEPDAAPAPETARGALGGGKASGPLRAVRVVAPSWRRVTRRSLLFAPVIVLLLLVVKPKHTRLTAASVVLTGGARPPLSAPLTYAVDTFAYRMYLKAHQEELRLRGRTAQKNARSRKSDATRADARARRREVPLAGPRRRARAGRAPSALRRCAAPSPRRRRASGAASVCPPSVAPIWTEPSKARRGTRAP